MENARGEDGVGFAWHIRLKFFRGREGQAAFAVEQFFQPFVLGTALTSDDGRRDQFTHFAAKPATLQPVFPTDGTFNRDAGDF